MNIKSYSLRSHLLLGIAIFALLSMVVMGVSESLFRQLAYQNHRAYTQELIDLKMADLLSDLEAKSKDMGLSLQRDKTLRAALKRKNKDKLITILNNQFNQYFVTAGVADLKKLYIYDKSMNLIAASSARHGDKIDNKLCPGLANKVMARSGPERLKTLSSLCERNGLAYHAVVIPVGGLKIEGYLQVVTDPTLNLRETETGLGMPVSLFYVNGDIAYRSSLWPDKYHIDHYLIIDDRLIDNSGQTVLNISVARDISEFQTNLSNMGNMIMLLSLLLMTPVIAIALYKLKTVMRPLNNLRRASESLSKGEHVHLTDRTYPEIDVVVESYNTMSEKITGLIQSLEEEISRRTAVEEELRQNKRELEWARDAALQASKSKSSFLANMSHEIRTPLTAIIGFSESLLNSQRSIPDRIDAIYTVIRSSKHLLSIINDLLDLSKIEADKLDIERIPVSPFDVVHEVKSIVELMAEEKGLSFTVEYNYPLPTEIESDSLRLKQILLNLCNNAIKFTREGLVRMVVSYDADIGSMKFNVIDTGIGLTDEQKTKIFKPFSQADSSITRKFGGTGLGLHLSRWLAEKMGGSLSVDSAYHVGSNFALAIACGNIEQDKLTNSYPDSERSVVAYAGSPNTQNIPQVTGRVLLAEDNSDNQKLVTMYLENAGIEDITVVNNGQDAVREVLANEFDLVMLDIQMPLMNGMDAVRALRKNDYQGPVIALTANAMSDDVEQCLAAGFTSHFAKPIDQNKFYMLLAKHLKEKESEGCDVPMIRSTLHNRSEKFDRMITGFVKNIPLMLDEINTAFNQDEFVVLQEAVHALKGVSGNYGFDELFQLLYELEREIKQKNNSAIREMLDKAAAINEGIQNAYRDKMKKSNVTNLIRR